MSEFVKFLGGCALGGKQVAVYKDGDGFRLAAETVGGKPVTYTYKDRAGIRQVATVRDKHLSAEGMEAFEEAVSAGYQPRDANIVNRALRAMGHPGMKDSRA
jgi:hypothetical protein